jgi:murein DD-endopeptidase MepM/ murein hydrolase activator NlpD
MESGATHLTFREPRRRRRWPLLIAVTVLGVSALGFAAYLPQQDSSTTAMPSPDDTPAATTGSNPVVTVRIPGPGTDSSLAVPPPEYPTESQQPARDADRAQGQASTDAPAAAEDVQDVAAPELSWEEHVVASGDTLSTIFNKLGIHEHLHPVLAIGGAEAKELQRLFPGERLRAGTRDGQLVTLVYEPRGDHYLEIRRENGADSFVAHRISHQLAAERRAVHAEIRQSLFLDGSRAGLSDSTLIQIAEIFGWDIDFAWDIRQGDRVIVVYERIYKDGAYLRDGPVLAAEFHNQGRTLRALRFAPEGEEADYYAPDGRSMRQAFIRTPVDVGRISSSFGPRKHPILGYARQHQGVDYAAPTGTPIRAAGNGRIVHRGNKGGYGKTVIIDHGNERRTLYAHMNGFRSGQSVGTRVSQGQIIGYVGMSGLATGPHLHYEFHLRGSPVNPVTVELPRAEPLPARHMEAFREATAPLLATLETLRDTQVAEGPVEVGRF